MNRRMLWVLAVAILGGCATPTERDTGDLATPATSDSTPPTQTAADTAEPGASAQASALPGGSYGPVWDLDPATAFTQPASCENLAGLPTQESGQNVAWRMSYPGDWSTQESNTGDCMWFGPEPWQSNVEEPVPPAEVTIAVSVLDGRVTPNSPEFEGGSVTREEVFTVAGAPAMRYEISGSDGLFLKGDGVIWVIGIDGELPDFDAAVIRNYLVLYSRSPASGAAAQPVDVLDRMVATLEILTP